jgi:hypothetical protein
MKTLNLVINYNSKVQFIATKDGDGILDSMFIQSVDENVRVVSTTVDEGIVYNKKDKYDDFVDVDTRHLVTLEVDVDDEDLTEDYLENLIEGVLMLESNDDHYIVFDYDIYGWGISAGKIVLANTPNFA